MADEAARTGDSSDGSDLSDLSDGSDRSDGHPGPGLWLRDRNRRGARGAGPQAPPYRFAAPEGTL